MRKINFDVGIADDFVHSADDRVTNLHLFPMPVGQSGFFEVVIEFKPNGGNVMEQAEEELDKYMKKTYPNKKYKIYYWNWLK